MEIEKIIDELEDILENSWHLPMSGGRTVIDANDIKRVLEDIRLNLPKEIVQANKIIEERSKIFDSAKSEVENMLKISEEKIKSMINKSEIVKKAQAMADEIVDTANMKAREIQKSANVYANKMMSQLEEIMSSNLSEIKKVKQALGNEEEKAK